MFASFSISLDFIHIWRYKNRLNRGERNLHIFLETVSKNLHKPVLLALRAIFHKCSIAKTSLFCFIGDSFTRDILHSCCSKDNATIVISSGANEGISFVYKYFNVSPSSACCSLHLTCRNSQLKKSSLVSGSRARHCHKQSSSSTIKLKK